MYLKNTPVPIPFLISKYDLFGFVYKSMFFMFFVIVQMGELSREITFGIKSPDRQTIVLSNTISLPQYSTGISIFSRNSRIIFCRIDVSVLQSRTW